MFTSRLLKPISLCGCRGKIRFMSGFSSMSPANLNDIVKTKLISKEPADRIETIWQEYHKKPLGATGFTLRAEDQKAIAARMKECKMFIWPVFKKGDENVILLSQVQDKFVFCTYLEDYKRNPNTASPWLSLTIYEDMCTTKGIALVRGDFTPNLTKLEGEVLSKMILHGYHDETAYKHLLTFNKNPASFNFDDYMKFFKNISKDLLEDIEAKRVKELAGQPADAPTS